MSGFVLRQLGNFTAISWREQVNFQLDDVDEVHFVLSQHAYLDLYSASSLKQQSADKQVTPLGHIILTPSQTVFVVTPDYCVLRGAATNTNFIVFGLTRWVLEPTIYHTQGGHANHYTTDVFGMKTRCWFALIVSYRYKRYICSDVVYRM